MAATNPNKANQYRPDPRQQLFLVNYINPKSKTFGNCYRSALKAGYADEYATTLTGKMPTWLAENVKDNGRVAKAEENLDAFLDEEEDKRLKFDATKFTLTKLKREKYGDDKEPDTNQLFVFQHIITNNHGLEKVQTPNQGDPKATGADGGI